MSKLSKFGLKDVLDATFRRGKYGLVPVRKLVDSNKLCEERGQKLDAIRDLVDKLIEDLLWMPRTSETTHVLDTAQKRAAEIKKVVGP